MGRRKKEFTVKRKGSGKREDTAKHDVSTGETSQTPTDSDTTSIADNVTNNDKQKNGTYTTINMADIENVASSDDSSRQKGCDMEVYIDIALTPGGVADAEQQDVTVILQGATTSADPQHNYMDDRKARSKRSKYCQKYTLDALREAVDEVKSKRLTYGKASKKYNIPKSTMMAYVSGKNALGVKAGAPRNIPESIENEFVDKFIHAAQRGFPLTKKQVLDEAARIIKDLQLKTNFRDGKPTHEYWRLLKQRRPDLVEAIQFTIAGPLRKQVVGREMKDSKQMVTNYFDCLEKSLEDGLAAKPQLIWNAKETKMYFTFDKSLMYVGKKANDRRCDESMAVTLCANAAGRALPLVCHVVKNNEVLVGAELTLDEHPSTLQASSSTRTTTVQSFTTSSGGTTWSFDSQEGDSTCLSVEWFRNVFLKHCGSERPQVLIMENYRHPNTLELLSLAEAEGIHLVGLPPDSAHALQPLDRVVSSSFGEAYQKICYQLGIINDITWPGILKKAWDEALAPAQVKEAFEAAGVYPFDSSKASEVEIIRPKSFKQSQLKPLNGKVAKSKSVAPSSAKPKATLNFIDDDSGSPSAGDTGFQPESSVAAGGVPPLGAAFGGLGSPFSPTGGLSAAASVFGQHNSMGVGNMRCIAARFSSGDELKQCLCSMVRAHRLKAAFILTCVGSLSKATIRLADSPTNSSSIVSIVGPLEIVSLTGTLSCNGSGSHLHVSVSDSSGQVLGGHVVGDLLVYTTAEVVLGVCEGVRFEREPDLLTGYSELSIYPDSYH